MRRLLSLIRKEFLQIARDPQSLKLLFLLPIVQTLVLGYAMTRDVHHIALGVLDLDQSPTSYSIQNRLIQNNRFDLHGHYSSVFQLKEALQKGDLLIGVIIPNGFAKSVEPGKILLLLDGQDAATAATAAGYASAIISQWGFEQIQHELLAEGLDANTLLPLELNDKLLYNPGLEYTWYMVPGLVILLATMMGSLLTSFSIVREREAGTLEQLMVTPVNPAQVIIGKSIPYWILIQVSFLIALAISSGWFQIPFHPSHLSSLLLGLSIYSLTSVALGILVSTLVTSQQQALFFIWFFLIFFTLTSGFLLPFESMPLWMQHLTELNGVRHFLYMVRALLLREAPAESLWLEYIKLIGISVLLLGTSIFAFRRQSS